VDQRPQLEVNLRALRARDPTLAARVEALAPLAAQPAATPSGHPTLTAGGVLLHNAHDPRREALRWGAAQQERLTLAGDPVAVVLGFGLGYHVEALADAWDGPIVVVEPDLALLRTALAARDLTAVLRRVQLVPGPIDAATVDSWGPVVLLPHAPSLLREGDALRGLRERVAGRAVLRDLRLKILVVSPLAGGSYPLTGYCARALAELGHDVTVLDLAPFAGGMEAIGRFTPKTGARRVIEGAFGRFLGTGILAAVEAAKPDLVLGMAQAPLDASILEEIGRRGALRAFWFVEDHRLFPYWRDVIAGYDHFFVIQQGEFLDEARRLTNGRAAYLPLAADPTEHRPLALTDAERAEYASPVSFVGAGYRNRRIAFRALLDQGLRIWGTEWRGAGPVEAVVQRQGARVSTADSVRIFNASDVNLNLHSSTWVDGVDPLGDFVNPRTFELAAAGAFQLVDERALLPSLFTPGTEVATFTDAGELRDLVRHWLARPDERAMVAAAARRRCLAEHTYRHRMETLLEAVCAADGDRLAARPRANTVGDAARAEGETPLGTFLRTLPPSTPFTLDGVVQRLLHREGNLTDAEAVLLFLHQFDELYVKEARQ
jgi:spore maturation protein CgeB